jgi:2-oxoisovalerate dehydrogenase E1 component alpha subunit
MKSKLGQSNLKIKSTKKMSKSGFTLSDSMLLKIYNLMVKNRVLEERLIKMYKMNDGFFWIGGPGEEAFNVVLGLLIKKGEGPEYDYFHGHYRSSGVLLALGAEPIDFIRQMKNTATDPFSKGRNFCGHAVMKQYNVVPITSPIEVQFTMAPGTAIANKRHSKDAITIVVGGDAGTAEGDFASCLVWSSRPANPLPVLMCVTNNHWGISTPASPQHGEKFISDRGKAFNMYTKTFNGNDVEETYRELSLAMEYCRKERKPALVEAYVSRLYGHSSASGANFVANEEDPIKIFEDKLIKKGILTKKERDELWQNYEKEMLELYQKVKLEPQPEPESIWDHIFHNQTGKQGKYGGE